MTSHPEIILNARKLRNNPTPMELRLWGVLRKKALDGYKFRRQAPIGPFIVDFYCPSAGLVIEVDGSGHIDTEYYDSVRTKYIESYGNVVIRFTNDEVKYQLDAVVEAIRDVLHERSCELKQSNG